MDDLQCILINLKVLQSLQSHTRLNTTEALFRIHAPASWIPTWYKRWWSAQTRVTDISRIQCLYQKAISAVEEENQESERIKKYLQLSIQGLENLRITYTNDVTTVALLEVVIDNVTTLLA